MTSNVIKAQDMVNHPPHYTHGGMETIDLIKHVTHGYPKKIVYQIGTVTKYLDRAPYKENMLQDLEKAAWYLNDAIKTLSIVTGKQFFSDSHESHA